MSIIDLASLEKSKRFWFLQLLGWIGLCILTYFSLTIWYTTEEFVDNLFHIFSQAIAGLLLSLLLRKVFLKLWDRNIYLRLIIVTLSIMLVAMLWNLIRMQLFISLVLKDDMPLENHPDWSFDKASIFFDFGKNITKGDGMLYYWDDVYLGEVLTRPDRTNSNTPIAQNAMQLPLDFDEPDAQYLFTDFGGVNTSIASGPTGLDGKVAMTQKWNSSLYWAGTTMSAATGFNSNIPISTENSKITVWVNAKQAYVLVRLKLEAHDNPQQALEVETEVVSNGAWVPAVFDFNLAETGDYQNNIDKVWRDFGGWYYSAVLIFLCWSALYHLIKYADLLRQERDKAHDQAKEAKYKSAKAQFQAKEAQLQMLRYQLNPPFLFNTLNTIYALTQLGQVDIAKSMISKLSQFLRYSLESNPNELIKFSQEVEALQLYLGIEKVRFEDRLEFSSEISQEAQRCLVPSMIVQPLIENSIKYAVSNRESTGIIKLTAQVIDNCLEISVSDNGPDKTKINTSSVKSTGIGINNIKQRLQTLYDGDFTMKQEQLAPSGLKVTIKLPSQLG
ncbi:MAG: hypothetical protein GJ680_10405 [Alteromonadaceae bacterium]|nr:hypothetical protein [Alteromonadaceae bacterium]